MRCGAVPTIRGFLAAAYLLANARVCHAGAKHDGHFNARQSWSWGTLVLSFELFHRVGFRVIRDGWVKNSRIAGQGLQAEVSNG